MYKDGWIMVPRDSWRCRQDEEITREGPPTFRVEKWDSDKRFATDEEALTHVMTSPSEICEYARGILLKQLFWST